MIKNKQNYSYDIFGNIALVKFPRDAKAKDKKRFAGRILSESKSIKTVLEKIGKFRGRLRKMQTKYVAGEKTKEVLYKENGCVFRFDIDKTYFSPRLSNERKEVASQIKSKDKVLVMFAGVAPFPIVIAKHSNAIVHSNEINREANKYAKLNIELNKLKNRVFLLPGDIKRVVKKINSLHLHIDKGLMQKSRGDKSYINSLMDYQANGNELGKMPKKYDVIIMPRPNLKNSFLKEAFALSKTGKQGTRIFYYDFCRQDEADSIVEKIKQEAVKSGKKIKILKTKAAGEIGAYKIRVRVDFKVV